MITQSNLQMTGLIGCPGIYKTQRCKVGKGEMPSHRKSAILHNVVLYWVFYIPTLTVYTYSTQCISSEKCNTSSFMFVLICSDVQLPKSVSNNLVTEWQTSTPHNLCVNITNIHWNWMTNIHWNKMINIYWNQMTKIHWNKRISGWQLH